MYGLDDTFCLDERFVTAMFVALVVVDLGVVSIMESTLFVDSSSTTALHLLHAHH